MFVQMTVGTTELLLKLLHSRRLGVTIVFAPRLSASRLDQYAARAVVTHEFCYSARWAASGRVQPQVDYS